MLKQKSSGFRKVQDKMLLVGKIKKRIIFWSKLCFEDYGILEKFRIVGKPKIAYFEKTI